MKINKQKYTPVRFSHLTSYASIGSVVRDVNDMLMAVADTSYWTDKNNDISAENIPYVTRVIQTLKLGKNLRIPPTAKELDNGDIEGNFLPAVLFPNYAVCKKCNLLHNNPWRKQDKHPSETVLCVECQSKLEQSTWCAVTSAGHLDNVPWHYICHKESDGTCKADYDTPYLKLINDKNGKRLIVCTRCGSKNNYEKLKTPRDKNDKRWFNINKAQPWLWGMSVDLDNDDSIEILEVNNPGVYLPERVNALVIPPESRISSSTLVDKLFNNSKLCREIEAIKQPLRKKGKFKLIATEYRASVDEVIDALQEIKDGYPFLEDNDDDNDLFEEEYKAFLEPLENVRDDEDFVTEHKTGQWFELKSDLSGELISLSKMIGQLINVKRLREIQVFKGFNRVEQNKEKLVPPDITGTSDWLPAIELFGEGMFFTLNEKLLSTWEKIPAVKKRADEIAARYEKSDLVLHQDIVVTPRFLLLHTLSHLIIRELEISAGYPAASLKERIYCSQNTPMSGILVYTAVADIVGSLGGIIESTEPKAFLALLEGSIKHAQWCSLDPVCTEHEGQGPGWLNRAACHACALIPEPSCGYNNVFLDRVFIKGNEELGIPDFLKFIERAS